MSTYGIAGTSPFGLFPKKAHLMLKDAVEALWNANSGSDPPASDIYFMGAIAERKFGDIQISFWPSIIVRPTFGKDTSWHRHPELFYISVHMFVRGSSVDEEPDYLQKVLNTFEKIIDENPTTLIPPAIVSIDRADPIPTEDNTQTTWHWVYNILVKYDIVRLT